MLSEVVRRLNTSLRSNIVLTDKILTNQTIYGEFTLDERPADIVKAICILINAKYITKPNGEIDIKRNQLKQNINL